MRDVGGGASFSRSGERNGASGESDGVEQSCR